MGGLVGVLLLPRGIFRLLQRPVYEAVFGIHDGRLAVFARLLLHAPGRLVALGHDGGRGGQGGDVGLRVAVVLEQFDGQIAGGVSLPQVGVGLEIVLYAGDAVFYLVSVVDVYVAVVRVLVLVGLVEVYHRAEQLFHAAPRGEHRGHHRHPEEAAQLVVVHVVAPLLGLVKHVQGAHHAQVHVDELRGEVEVALEVGRVYHVDHHVGRLLDDLLAHVEFLGRVGRERVGARQVHEVERVAVVFGVTLLRVHGHTRVVAHPFVRPGDEVEERSLSAVGVAHQCHVDYMLLAQCCVFQQAFAHGTVVGHGVRQLLLLAVGLFRPLLHVSRLLGCHHLYLFGFTVAQRNLISHDFVFHGILQRCVEQHLHGLALDESHLDDALAETAVSRHFHDDTPFAGFEF